MRISTSLWLALWIVYLESTEPSWNGNLGVGSTTCRNVVYNLDYIIHTEHACVYWHGSTPQGSKGYMEGVWPCMSH